MLKNNKVVKVRNKIRVLISIIAIILLVLIIRSTYSKYANSAVGSLLNRVSNWVIKVNGENITLADNPAEILIGPDEFVWNWDDVAHVKKPKVAPGMVGSFYLEIDPAGTQVSFEYDISIKNPVVEIPDVGEVEIDMVMNSIEEINGNRTLIETNDPDTGNRIIKRLKPLTEIMNTNPTVQKDLLKVTVEWRDTGNKDLLDTLAGSEAGHVIEMPIQIHAIQYTGN